MAAKTSSLSDPPLSLRTYYTRDDDDDPLSDFFPAAAAATHLSFSLHLIIWRAPSYLRPFPPRTFILFFPELAIKRIHSSSWMGL